MDRDFSASLCMLQLKTRTMHFKYNGKYNNKFTIIIIVVKTSFITNKFRNQNRCKDLWLNEPIEPKLTMLCRDAWRGYSELVTYIKRNAVYMKTLHTLCLCRFVVRTFLFYLTRTVPRDLFC